MSFLSRFNLVLLLGLLIYFGSNFLKIQSAPMVLEYPRLGDDALVYANKGRNVFDHAGRQHVVSQNLVEQFANQSLNIWPSTKLTDQKSRQDSNYYRFVLGAHAIGAGQWITEIVGSLWSQSTLPIKWVASLNELFVLILFTLSLTFFFSAIWNPTVAGLALTFLPWVYFSGQGVQQFVPSVLALGAGLIFLTSVFSFDQKSKISYWRWGQLLVFIFIAHSIHMIFVAYLAIGLCAVWLDHIFQRMLQKKPPPSHRIFTFTMICLTGSFLWQILAINLKHFNSPFSDLSQTSRSLSEVVMANWSTVVSRLNHAFERNLAVLILGLFALWHARARERWCLMAITLAMGASLGHNLASYPGELFKRILVLWWIFLLGLGLNGLLSRSWSKTWKVSLLIALFVFQVNSYSKSFLATFFNGFNRASIFYDDEFLNLETQLRPKRAIVYSDSTESFRLATYYWGKNYGALPVEAYPNKKDFQEALEKYRPTHFISKLPRFLDGVGYIAPFSFEKRRLGIPLHLIKTVELKDCLPAKAQVEIKNFSNSDATFTFTSEKDGKLSRNAQVKAAQSQFFEFGAHSNLTLQSVDHGLWITGIRHKNQSSAVAWPWGSRCQLRYEPWVQRKSKRSQKWEFNFGLEYFVSDPILALIKIRKTVSDRSGLIVFEISP